MTNVEIEKFCISELARGIFIVRTQDEPNGFMAKAPVLVKMDKNNERVTSSEALSKFITFERIEKGTGLKTQFDSNEILEKPKGIKGSIVKHFMDADTEYRVIDIKGNKVYVEKNTEDTNTIGAEIEFNLYDLKLVKSA